MKKVHLSISEDQLSLLIMGLRYLELSHPIHDNPNHEDYRSEFRKLLDGIINQLNQTMLFEG